MTPPHPKKNKKTPQKQKDQTNKQKQKTIQEINNIFLSLLGNLKVLYQKTKLMFCVFIAIFNGFVYVYDVFQLLSD